MGPRKKLTRPILIGAALLAVAFALLRLPPQEHEGVAYGPTSLLPALLTLGIAVASRRVLPAIACGVVAGAFVTQGAAHLDRAVILYGVNNLLDTWHLCIAGFAVTTLGMIRLIEASGATETVVLRLTKDVRSARGAQLATAFAGLVVFFDDYANTFIVGSGMRPVSDRFRLSRQKLAYLVDSTAAPVAGLAVLSTWIAYEAGLLNDIGGPLDLKLDGYGLVLAAVPLRFYSWYCLLTVFLVAALGRDVEPMLSAERQARQATGLDAARPLPLPPTPAQPVGRALLAAGLPLAVLVISVITGYVVDGAHPSSLEPLSLPWWRARLQHAEHGEVVLLLSAVAATSVALLSTLATGLLSPSRAIRAFLSGVRAGAGPMALLFGAWSLGAISKDAGTGQFVVATLEGMLEATWLPCATFLLSATVAFATGSSWGTMAIILPSAVPLAAAVGEPLVLFATVAAVMDGSIFGDHCSPLSDTTMLSATACECDLLSHTTTQLPYALACMVAAATAYYSVVRFSLPSLWVIAGGAAALGLWLLVVGRSPEPRATPRRANPS